MITRKMVLEYAVSTLNFDACHLTSPFVAHHLDEYKAWISEGRIGDMQYLMRHLPFKENPELLLPHVKTAIVLIKNYKNTTAKNLDNTYKIARYAVGEDYHHVFTDKMAQLVSYLQSKDSQIQYYFGVDSRPIPERSLALQAGIGFRGKNTMVIHPRLGSFLIIGVIYTTALWDFDPPLDHHCGQCDLCIKACPTGALSVGKGLDVSKCLSYQTIERKSALSDDEKKLSQGWRFGCDRCQEVCPYNATTPLTDWACFMPKSGVGFNFLDQYHHSDEMSVPKSSPLFRNQKYLRSNLS